MLPSWRKHAVSQYVIWSLKLSVLTFWTRPRERRKCYRPTLETRAARTLNGAPGGVGPSTVETRGEGGGQSTVVTRELGRGGGGRPGGWAPRPLWQGSGTPAWRLVWHSLSPPAFRQHLPTVSETLVPLVIIMLLHSASAYRWSLQPCRDYYKYPRLESVAEVLYVTHFL